MKGRVFLSIAVLIFPVSCAAPRPSGDLIPRELAEDLTNGQVYLDVPSGFPPFDLAEGIEVVGSLDRNNNVQLILRSELTGDALNDAVTGQFLERGWIELTRFSPNQSPGGFVSPFPPNFPENLPGEYCHDRYGMMRVNARGEDGIHSRLSLNWNRRVGGIGELPCEEQNQVRQGNRPFRPGRPGFGEFMPVLELPPEDRGTRFQPFFGGRTSTSGTTIESSSPLVLDWNLARIHDWFTDQLDEQGWEREGGWMGDSTAGSSWTHQTDSGTRLSGLLDILHVEGESYELRFRMTPRIRNL